MFIIIVMVLITAIIVAYTPAIGEAPAFVNGVLFAIFTPMITFGLFGTPANPIMGAAVALCSIALFSPSIRKQLAKRNTVNA